MKFFIKLIAVAVALLVAEHVVPGISVSSIEIALIVSIVLAIINIIIKPILWLLTLPINFLTLGLFSFILNALMFWLAAAIVPGFVVSGFIAALLGSLIVSAVNFLVSHLLP